MNRQLIDNNFLVIKNFIDSKRAKSLYKEFKKYCEENYVGGDPQVPDTPGKYNYSSFLELLCEKTLEVSKIIEEPVLPTYCYTRIYKNGDVLKKHVDRDACEISMTLHLDGDLDWEIYVENPSGDEVPVKLESGDALIYFGCDAPHWRNSFTGNFYSQVFLHYVRSKGERSYTYFDKVKKSKKLNEELLHLRANTKLEEFVNIFENIIPEELCDKIISEYLDDELLEHSKVGDGVVDSSIRNCRAMKISSSSAISKNYSVRKEIDDQLFEIAGKVINTLRSKFRHLSITQDSGYDLLKYETGGFYIQHTDSFTTEQRAISCSFILNDDYDGGEFGFFDRELIYKLKKGSVITFPSNFMYPHEIMPVISGTRYSIITWFV